MTRFQLTIANRTFEFRPEVALLWAAAGVVALLMMVAYVAALHDAVQRGELLREARRASAGPTHIATPQREFTALNR